MFNEMTQYVVTEARWKRRRWLARAWCARVLFILGLEEATKVGYLLTTSSPAKCEDDTAILLRNNRWRPMCTGCHREHQASTRPSKYTAIHQHRLLCILLITETTLKLNLKIKLKIALSLCHRFELLTPLLKKQTKNNQSKFWLTEKRYTEKVVSECGREGRERDRERRDREG